MTDEPNLSLYKTHPVDQLNITFKAMGFWYAIGDAWIEWCRGEMEEWIDPYLYTFSFKEGSNILMLDTEKKVRQFHNDYSHDRFGLKQEFKLSFREMNWEQVNKDYDGVEFNPYFYDLRFDFDLLWYNGIDVASGVIFNTDVVCNLERHKTKSFF